MSQPISSLADIPAVKAYLDAIGAEPRSLVTAVVRELHGKYYTDTVIIRLDKHSGEITTFKPDTGKPSPEHEPTKALADRIKATIGDYRFPTPIKTKHYELPPQLKSVRKETVFEFKSRTGELEMIVQRVDNPRTGDKTYLPWTLFDDGEWRQCEPDGKLPLYGLDQLEGDTVFIHEGPKKAYHCNKLFRNAHTVEEIAERDVHPWKEEMMHGVHIAFHGGALTPYRTDWSELKKAGVKNAFIIPDNDGPGVKAVAKISKQLRDINVYSIVWTKKFPTSFDMADPWPSAMFEEHHYVGPSFFDLLAPATWATDKFDDVKGSKKPIVRIRDQFASQWIWVADVDTYFNVRFPFLSYSQSGFDKALSSYSDTKKTSDLLHALIGTMAYRLTYRPDVPHRLTDEPQAPAALNTYIAPTIKATSGNSQPFEDFLDYMFVNPDERHQVKRYIATLIAHPEIRIPFAQLWVSQTQGIGKNTLGEHILAPLIGIYNCSFPSEQMIVESQFNSWMARKRLIFVGEIYSGHSWKAYNKLKSFITDKTVTVNEKFVREYSLNNWAHIIACSNSERALKIEAMDRRWFCPDIAATPWSRDQFEELYKWIKRGGLGVVKHWAENFGDYIKPGENAPMTERKKLMIEESMTDEERLVKSWCENFNETMPDHEMVVCDRIIKNFLTNDHDLQVRFVRPVDLRNVLKAHGWLNPGFQLGIDGIMQTLMLSPACAKIWREKPAFNTLPVDEQQKWRDWLRKRLRSMSDPQGKGAAFVNQAKTMGL